MKQNNTKAQIWFMDFVIAMIIFLFMLILYYTYITDISKQGTPTMGELISNAKTVASSLTSSGDPINWNSNNVVRIGLTDSYNRIDDDRFDEFMEINYNKTKKLLGTNYDYFLFFVNGSDDVQNIRGFCGTGLSEVTVDYDLRAAYYYQASGDPEEEVIKGFMETFFDADVYYDKINGAIVDINDQSALRNNINNYDFVVVEHPTWSNSDFVKFVNAVDDPVDPPNSWLSKGGILFLGGQMGSDATSDGFYVTFGKNIGANEFQRTATVVNVDPYVKFNLLDEILFSKFFHVYDDDDDADLIDIARFNNLGGEIALGRWIKGEGKILFFSSFNAEYLAGGGEDFKDILEGSAKKWANAQCRPINITGLERNNLVKVERMVIQDSNLLKMVLYLWE